MPKTVKLPKIFVADDDRNVTKLLESVLSSFGYAVLTVHNGKDALDQIDNTVDVVLLDVMMPGMDGFQVLTKLKSSPSTSHIPVVMITSLTDRDSKVRGKQLGADDFINKPIDNFELIARVGNLRQVKEYHDLLRNHNKQLEEEVRNRMLEIKESNLETIQRLAASAEFRDGNTGSHIERIGEYSRIIAQKLNLPTVEIENIYYASPMHDIGKIGIPDEILLKPGKLTDKEYEVMKTHTTIGAKILSGSKSPLVRTAEQIALSHHEKFNGKGYPNGLKGEETPMSARIVAVADVFDALTTDRAYKSEYSSEKSVEIIKEEKGKHFDPEITEAFLDCLDEIESVKKHYK